MTRPPPPAAATCNLFCLRARVAGAGAAGSGRGVAPQLRRWCWRSAGRSGAPSPEHPVPATSHRPAPSPPLPPALPRSPAPGSAAAAGGRAPRGDCGAEREESRDRGCPAPPTPRCGDCRGRGTRGWSRLRPVARAGLKEARCCRCHHRRSGPGPSVQPSPPATARPGMLAAPGSPSPPACREWEGDGAPPPARTESAAFPPLPPPQLRWPGDPVRCAAGASPWTGPSSRCPGQGRGGWPEVAEGRPRPARGPLHRSPHRAGEVPSARAASPARPPAGSGRLCPGHVGPVPLPGLWQGCSGRKTNLCRRPFARLRLPARRAAGRRGAPRRGAAGGSAGTHLSAAQGASVSFDTPLLLRV